MLDKILNPVPTIYKWDRFWAGFIPALLLPVVSFFLFFLLTAAYSKFIDKATFSFTLFLYSIKGATSFLRTSTLCCLPNAAVFFFFIQRNYYNASRAVVFTTMLYVIAIVIKDTL